jgi:bifunctional aspartokinase / homoserine dehydrogenase 1
LQAGGWNVAEQPWKYHKFGGSSLFDADCFRRVAAIIEAQGATRIGVVVSAMGGMTDRLLRLASKAERDDRSFQNELDELGERYSAAVTALLAADERPALLDQWSQDARDLRDLLVSVAAVKSAPQRTRDQVAGYGELWSARLLAAYLARTLPNGRGGRWLDARRIVTVRQGELGPAVNWPVSQRKYDSEMADFDEGVVVVTGFIAADEEGCQTTLGRNGSDFSGAIFAALAGADELTIWTDVDGVMSGDPNRVPEAQIIDALSYNEALELAYFGAKVIHPQTLGPAIDNNIAVLIRNTFAPDRPGSRIGATIEVGNSIKGITAIDGMALVNLEGTGMIGVPGTADRLFAALKRASVSVTLISQASSEHSICIAVPEELADRARNVISEAFADELEDGQIQRVDVTRAQSIIAVVGDNMAGAVGLAARFFSSLARAGINVRAIAQGSSERNISAVIDAGESTRALRAVHSGFYLSTKTVSIGLIGPGLVGGTLLDQLHRRHDALVKDFQIDFRIRGIARSSKMELGDKRIELGDWRETLSAAEQAFDLETFIEHIDADHLPHAVIVDCTSSDDIASHYADWLARGIHVVTPNKKAFSGKLAAYENLQKAARRGNAHYLYETTIGAALPIISTVRDLIDTGDRVHSITGIFSGTLAYLFNVYDGSKPFSEIVRGAKDSGYTEPDPRDDLSGMDVARKLTILARELGLKLELGEFPVQNLIPEDLRELPVAEFLKGLERYDEQIDAQYQEAKAAGKVLRYVATLNEKGEAEVGLQMIPLGHALANINLTDNIVQFVTDRYAENPLVVQGPGAGPEVTAGGVFGDLLRLAAYLKGAD